MSNENKGNINTRSKLAKGLDYFSVRLTIFILLLIAINQMGVNFYISIILASFITAFINRQVNAIKQKRLTRIAKAKSLQETAEEKLPIEDKKNNLDKSKPKTFILTGLFLIGLALFFEGWFKYYFGVFGIINFSLAILFFYKSKKTLIREEK